MNISYKWLKRFIDTDLSPRELAAALTSLGLECDTVEEVETIRGGLRGIVIGHVLTCEEHPNSDHLHITTVDLGGDAPVQIVCGAPNVAAGQKVVVATVGTTLYDGDKEFQIKKSKIRGVESFGMICAEDEIGLGTGHDGIMVLDGDAVPGTPAAAYFNIESDYMLEVELTPNRVDGASHLGVARDLKAWMRRHGDSDVNVMIPSVSSFSPDSATGAACVMVENNEACPRYSGVTVRGVTVKESPEWLRNLLISAGQRPINNVVDITNFILLGLGQPLHCFDLGKVKDETIVVRNCAEGTPFVTLDGVERKLNSADLMICDTEKPLCIAGVFGGLDSGVTEQTRDIFIESAWFNATSVRKTARRHGLSTDASFRYERGTDPEITVYAAKLAALLVKELAGGEICGDPVDIYPDPVSRARVTLDLDYCASLIGKNIPDEEVKSILRSLDIKIAADNGDTLELEIPRYRVDVTRPCDVVEEILRVYGYNNVEITDEMNASLSIKGATDLSFQLQNIVAEQLTAQGFREIMNNSLSAVSYYDENEKYPLSATVRLLNPLSNDLAAMRQTLLYGGLESIAHNINRRNSDLMMYEFGNVYHFDAEEQPTSETPLAQYAEGMRLGIWMTGDMRTASWDTTPQAATVFELKAIVLNVLERLGIEASSLVMTQDSDAEFEARLSIATRSGKTLGELGVLRAGLLRRFDIKAPVYYAELDWKAIMKPAVKSSVKFSDIAKTQPVRRDLALLLDKEVKFADVESVIRSSDKRLLRDVTLFDVYEGDKLPAGKKSYAVAITLQDNEKTLQDKQIDAVMKKVTTSLEQRLGATLR